MSSDAPHWEATARRYRLGEQDEWLKLLEHFDFSVGFGFVVLLVPDADGAALCRHELEAHLALEHRTLRVLEVPTPADLQRLPEHFLEESCGENTACLWLSAVAPDYTPDYAAWRAAWEHTLSRLNAFRNPIRERFKCTLLFAGAPWLQEVLRETAPDLWSVRTIVVNIQTAPQQAETTLIEPQRAESSSSEDAPDPYFALQRAEKLRGVPGKELELADLLHRAGQGFQGRKEWHQAEIAYSEAWNIKNEFGASESSLLSTTNNWASVALGVGQPYYTENLSEYALTLAEGLGDLRGKWVAMNNLGSANYALGRTDIAIQYHMRALEIAHQLVDKEGEGQILNNLGIAYSDLGKFGLATQYYHQSLDIMRQIANRRGESATLSNLGIAYHYLGKVSRAIECYEQSLTIAREIGDQRGEGHALWNWSLALDELGDREKAVELAIEALAIYEQIEDPNAAKVRAKLEEWRSED